MRVLLATDGSESAHDAEWLLARIPFPDPVNLVIAHVEVAPSLAHLKREFPSSVDGIEEQFHARSKALLADEMQRFEGINGTVESCLRVGNPAETLIDLATEKKSDLIIMGARQQTTTQRFLLGSTSAAVAKHADCSVLVTRPSQQMKSSNRSFRIVVGIDGSEASRQAVEMLSQFHWGQNVEILVVSVLETGRLGSVSELQHTIQANEKRAFEEIVDQAVEQLKATTSRVSGEVICAMPATEELLNTLQRLSPDLVVLGHQGMSRIKRFFMGSTCERVLRHANCSVWIHKESQKHST